MNRSAFETLVGFIVLVIAGCFLYYSYRVGHVNVGESYSLRAKFDRIDGLSVGSDVKLSGVRVGTITNIDVDAKTYRALVTFTLRHDIQLPVDSFADVVTDGLLGGKYIHLTPGAEDEMLSPNSWVEYTQSSMNLETLISKFMFNNNKEDGANTSGDDIAPPENLRAAAKFDDEKVAVNDEQSPREDAIAENEKEPADPEITENN